MATVESELWTEVGRGIMVPITVNDYGNKIIAWVDTERITSSQVVKALEEEYPGIEFDTRLDVSPGNIYAVGKKVL